MSKPLKIIGARDAFCSFVGVSKSYDGKSRVLDKLSIEINEGELVTFLGPSGSGKSTTLMLLAGFEVPDEGEIYFRGKPISQLPSYRRNFGVVFQSYALFPHMTVAENISFPLKMRGLDKSEIAKRLERGLDMIRMKALADRKPAQLSGGQQQRVALARSLVFDPNLVLLDEPLAALDKNLREELQMEIRHLHQRLGVTMLYVTHDQSEALSISDRVAVFNKGHVEQFSTPTELYNSPGTRFIASFVGKTNFLRGTFVDGKKGELAIVRLANGDLVKGLSVADLQKGSSCDIAVRPEWIRIAPPRNNEESGAHIRVSDVVFQGESVLIRGELANTNQITLTAHPTQANHIEIGMNLQVSWPNKVAQCFDVAK